VLVSAGSSGEEYCVLSKIFLRVLGVGTQLLRSQLIHRSLALEQESFAQVIGRVEGIDLARNSHADCWGCGGIRD